MDGPATQGTFREWQVTRRAMLRGAALTTGVAATALAVIDPQPAGAAEGDPVLAGEQTTTSGSTVLYGVGGNFGILVATDTAFDQLPAYEPAAVVGVQLTAAPAPNTDPPTGVFGLGTIGVSGYGDGADGIGVAAYAGSTGATALAVAGRATFDGPTSFERSGVTTVHGSKHTPLSSVVVSGVALSPQSMVLATCQVDVPGVAVRSAVKDVKHNRITIHLTAAAHQPVAVAWFVLS